MRNLLTSLFQYGKVKTTDAKAKALMTEADKLIAKAKNQSETFNSIRELNKVLFTETASKAALAFLQKTKKTSGFTRSTRVNVRSGDSAVLIQVELITDEKE